MLIACSQGNLEVAQWLFDAGAGDDLNTPNESGTNPLFWACARGFVEVVEFIAERGGADLRAATPVGVTPLRLAAEARRHPLVLWLLLRGAASAATDHSDDDDDAGDGGGGRSSSTNSGGRAGRGGGGGSTGCGGHVDGAVLERDLPGGAHEARQELCRALRAILDQHQAFARVFIPAASAAAVAAAAAGAEARPPGKRPSKHPAVGRLGSHESGLLRLVGEFVGVEHGRRLRTAREALGFLHIPGLPLGS